METNVPDGWCQSIAAELHRIAYDLGGISADLPEPGYVHLDIQPSGSVDEKITAIDNLGLAVAGKPGQPYEMHDGTFHYHVEVRRGPVVFKVYTGMETALALRMIQDRKAADKDAELERLRARVAEFESGRRLPSDPPRVADPTGLAYSRADDEPDDPTPVSGARVEPHVGGLTDEGLVDETRPPMHFSASGTWTACEQLIGGGRFPVGDGWTNVGGEVTCQACLDEMPKAV